MGKGAGEEVWGCARSPPASPAVKIEGHRRLQKLERPGNRFPPGASRRNFTQWDPGQSSDLQNRKITRALSVVICLCSSRKHTATGRGMRKPRGSDSLADLTAPSLHWPGAGRSGSSHSTLPLKGATACQPQLRGTSQHDVRPASPRQTGQRRRKDPNRGGWPHSGAGRGQASSQLVPAAKGGQSERAHFRRRASVVPRKLRDPTVGLIGLRGW